MELILSNEPPPVTGNNEPGILDIEHRVLIRTALIGRPITEGGNNTAHKRRLS